MTEEKSFPSESLCLSITISTMSPLDIIQVIYLRIRLKMHLEEVIWLFKVMNKQLTTSLVASVHTLLSIMISKKTLIQQIALEWQHLTLKRKLLEEKQPKFNKRCAATQEPWLNWAPRWQICATGMRTSYYANIVRLRLLRILSKPSLLSTPKPESLTACSSQSLLSRSKVHMLACTWNFFVKTLWGSWNSLTLHQAKTLSGSCDQTVLSTQETLSSMTQRTSGILTTSTTKMPSATTTLRQGLLIWQTTETLPTATSSTEC